MMEVEKLRYPIGEFSIPSSISRTELIQFLWEIEQLPLLIKEAVLGLTEQQLSFIYRKNGWNIKQLVNHLVDSHSNSVIRFKLTLTEEFPTIRPYEEDKWALLADTTECPLNLSINLLENIHLRWIILLKSISEKDWERKLFHPGSKKEYSLKELAALYAWHGKHHLAHIVLAKQNSLLASE